MAEHNASVYIVQCGFILVPLIHQRLEAGEAHLSVLGAGISHCRRQSLHRLDVVGKHVQTAARNRRHAGCRTREVRREDLQFRAIFKAYDLQL